MERLAASVRVQLTLNYLMLGGSVAGPGGVALSTAKYARPGESPCPVELETNLCEDHGESPYARAFSWLKAPMSPFTLKTLLRHT